MKTVPAAALVELAKEHGTEPLIIIGIEWVTGSVTYYSDKALTGVKSKILSLGEIESLTIDNVTSFSVAVELDDTDGEIKTVIDTKDIHKVSCVVYQFYGALSDLNDKFTLFQGQISTPFTWHEKERSVSFTIVSEIESYEVGFSPEEGQLDFVNDEYVGKPWPLCFGNVVHAPAQPVSQVLEGTLLDEVCIVDESLRWKQERLRTEYFQQAFLMKMFVLVANGAETLAPPAREITTLYVRAILEERAVMTSIRLLLDDLDHFKTLERRGLNTKPFIANLENQLNLLSVVSNIIQQRKEDVEKLIDLAEFKFNTQQDAFRRVTAAYNAMREIYGEYMEVQQEICNQEECEVTQVRIQGGSKFPQGVIVEIYIESLKFRGMFEGDLFTFIGSPTAKHGVIEVDDWVPDDDGCAPDDETNGVNMFWLKDEPPVNLVGLYLLVKKKGGEEDIRHIIHVERQVGRKVYFDLVQWGNVGQGDPRGQSLDAAIGALRDIPFIPTPWGGTLPADLFNGDWAVSAWNQPESRRLLQIISSIPGGVNGHELELLAKLVYLEPQDDMNGLAFAEVKPRDVFTIIGEDIEIIHEASGTIHKHWLEDWEVIWEEIPDSIFWHAESGASVRDNASDCLIYIANILPSVIHGVHAYRTLENGSRILATVPSSYYVKNETAVLGTITATALTFPIALKNIAGEGWEDDVYVTLTSSIGPNVVDVIEWLIETYTNVGVNAANFAAIKAKFQDGSDELYPVGFCLLERPNVLEEVARIAWEARCAVYRVGSEFFLKYLSEEPATDMTFSEDDIDSDNHYEVSFPQTESLTTRLVSFWKPNYLPLEDGDKPDRIILRHNVKKYGLHSEDVEFHIYNVKELVYKSATFWLIRKSNTWKHVSFQTFLTKIRLDPFDTVLLDMDQPHIASEAVKGVVQSIVHDSTLNVLNIELELPIKAGEMEAYPLYWPAQEPEETEFPTRVEIEEGYAGGHGPGSGVTGTIDDC
jgi:hypothetical protein